MAKSTMINQVVETPVGVTLELSMAEAEVLVFILGRVGGKHYGPRRHAEDIFVSLQEAGVEWAPDYEKDVNALCPGFKVSGGIQVEPS